jgi:hypothetical protein
MILLPIATAAIGATTVLLSTASVWNMYETHTVIRDSRKRPQRVYTPPSWKTTDEAVMELSSMKKRELLQLFLHCDPPSTVHNLAFGTDNRQGEKEVVNDGLAGYDGYLLNNGPILTRVTKFITHQLFGRGKRWLGKVYMPSIPSSIDKNDLSGCGTGRNRFLLPYLNGNYEQNKAVEDRTFDYYIGKSVLPSASSTSSSATSKSLFHSYAPHCPITWSSPMSLIWRGMVDELRVVPLEHTNDDNEEKALLLLGMGYFTWSGGVKNLAPFCLVARPQKNKV